MRNFWFVLYLLAPAWGAGAQPAPELLRSDLRAALKSPQSAQPSEKKPTSDAEVLELRRPYDRHLSAQERSDLRQQLRQLHDDEAPFGAATQPN